MIIRSMFFYKYQKYNLKWYDLIYLIGVLLIPFDSLPYVLTSTVYRPISVFFFLFYWLIVRVNGLVKGRFTFFKEEFIFLVLLIISILYSFGVAMYFYSGDVRGVIDFIITASLGFFSFSGGLIFWKRIKVQVKDNDEYILFLRTITKAMLILPLIIGSIQAIGVIGILPQTLIIKITKLFSYRSLGDRVQLTTGEPAMAARLLFVSMFIWFTKDISRKTEMIFGLVLIFEFCLTFSLLGYLSIPLVLILYYLYNFNWLKKFSKLIIIFLIIMCSVFLLYFIGENYLLDNYMMTRLMKIKNLFNNNNIYKAFILLIKKDGSIFMRIINPVIGGLLSFKTYFLGAGGGYYYYHYPNIIKHYFPWAIKYTTVFKAVKLESLITPKSFYAKLLGENGIIIFMIFIFLLFSILKKIRKLNLRKINRSKIILVFFAMIVMLFNMDSWAYNHFWLLISFFVILLK